jgi:hypothetical protein
VTTFHKHFALIVFFALASARGAENPSGADGAGAYTTGHYRNLFAENGHSKREIRKKLMARSSNCFMAVRRTRPFTIPPEAIPTVRWHTSPTSNTTMCERKVCPTG